MASTIFPTAFVNDETGYPDMHVKPDVSTLRMAGWKENTAYCFCNTIDPSTGEPIPFDGRAINDSRPRRRSVLTRMRLAARCNGRSSNIGASGESGPRQTTNPLCPNRLEKFLSFGLRPRAHRPPPAPAAAGKQD